jgi:hypothetical protein
MELILKFGNFLIETLCFLCNKKLKDGNDGSCGYSLTISMLMFMLCNLLYIYLFIYLTSKSYTKVHKYNIMKEVNVS